MFVSNLDPVAISIGAIQVRWYGLLFAGGFLIGYAIMHWMFKQKAYKTEDLDKMLLLLFIGTVIGARLGHCLIYEPDYFLSHPVEILKVWKGGLASHGGTVGVLLAIAVFVSNRPYTFLEMTDMLSVPVALVSTLIRVGNFINSEILGKATNSDYGVVFARLGEDFPRHPVQIYESVAYFVTFLILGLIYIKWKNRPNGAIFGLLFIFIFGARFFIEPFKVEQADYSTGTIFTVGQYLSIPFILFGILTIVYAKYKARKG
ncbi:MAG TPA: prolipoprotein diacylglyceryl transferase [Succinivibrionaceae bacterium]|nr:prolipoprotein diacylglyceryl transferase [Succinivibrio sp.]HAR79325.1 prolipoprotein diacylglyceryl transferase [Succinivibrionaceae bacterium]